MNLRTRFERFCYRNRDKGIPNLMLYITIGSAIVTIMSMINGGDVLLNLLRFDKTKILQGQVWRLFTYVFTENTVGSFLSLIFLYFFYNLGRHTEMCIGTFKFNLFYFSGVILMDVFAMAFCPTQDVIIGNYIIYAEDFTNIIYSGMAFYLHLSILLMFASANPNAQFLVLFIIPVKAWFMGLVYLLLVGIEIFNMSYPLMLFPHNLFPLVGLLNFILFAGKDAANLLPFLQPRRRYTPPKHVVRTESIPYNTTVKPKAVNYTHRCTVCGRTDVSNPELEFRYCSRCNGYFCYCEDHINNHTHVE